MIQRGGVILALVCCSLAIGNANCEYEGVASAYAGWYIGGGISHQYTKGNVILDDNLRDYAAITGDVAQDARGLNLSRTNVRRVGAVLAFGYGDFITGNCYFGGEIDLDITGSKSTETEVSEDYSVTKLKTRGFVPTFALRLGGYIQEIDCMFYVRVGLAFLNNKFENQLFAGQGFGSKKVAPMVGLGVEKAISDSCSLRIEGDYRFPADKKRDDLVGYLPDGRQLGDPYTASINNKVRGYAVRVVFVYHF